jgi:nucleotide-binding universal stress UspA family protein
LARSEDNAPILIAYDGSDFARAAIAEAGRQLAPSRRAIVLTVSEPLEEVPFLGASGAPIDPGTMDQFLAAAREGAEKIAEEGCALARDAGFEAESRVLIGDSIWSRIVENADQEGADLIVIGSRGRSGLKLAVLGSVAAAVAQHSKRSVLIVHQG